MRTDPVSLAQLAAAGRAPDLPLALATPPLTLIRLLRVLPGQRYVGVARWHEGKTVLAKVLVGPRARRQFASEVEGAQRLAQAGLPTPALLASDSNASGAWLLFDYLDGAQNLGDLWESATNRPATQTRLLAEALALIARLHAAGLWQDDLHLNNLMRWQDRLVLIDGGGIRAETPGTPLSPRQSVANLGVLFAQLPIRLETDLPQCLAPYLARHPLSPSLLDAPLRQAIARERRIRIDDLLKKTGRDCSLFHVKTGPAGLLAVRRDEQAALSELLVDPDAFIARGKLYKTGGTATVAQVEIDGRALVVKRYNLKSFWHGVRRCWRRSRAWHAWREGYRLLALGIPTPRPLALLERRHYGLTGVAYLITEYLPGPDLIELLQRQNGQLTPRQTNALNALIADLKHARLSHGDLKGHNLLWCAAHGNFASGGGGGDAVPSETPPVDGDDIGVAHGNFASGGGGGDAMPDASPADDKNPAGHWALIDLDAMRSYASRLGDGGERLPSLLSRFLNPFARAHARDKKRLQRNFTRPT